MRKKATDLVKTAEKEGQRAGGKAPGTHIHIQNGSASDIEELAGAFSDNGKATIHQTKPQFGGFQQGGATHGHPETGSMSASGPGRLHVAGIAPTVISGAAVILAPATMELWNLSSQYSSVHFSIFDYAGAAIWDATSLFDPTPTADAVNIGAGL